MAEEFYTRMQGVAAGLLARFSQGNVALVRTTRTAVDPVKPWVGGAETTATYPLNAVVRTVEKKYIDGTLIEGSEVQATFPPISVEPKLSDRLSVDGRVRAIKRIIRIPEAGIAVVYTVLAEA